MNDYSKHWRYAKFKENQEVIRDLFHKLVPYSEVWFNDHYKTASKTQLIEHLKYVRQLVSQATIRKRQRIPEEVIQAIRSEYVPRSKHFNCLALSRKYGVSQKHIWDIVNNRKRTADSAAGDFKNRPLYLGNKYNKK